VVAEQEIAVFRDYTTSALQQRRCSRQSCSGSQRGLTATTAVGYILLKDTLGPPHVGRFKNQMSYRQTPALDTVRLGAFRILDVVRSHRAALTIAFIAVLGETVAGVLEPWPIKVVVDHLLQSKKLSGWLAAVVSGLFGHTTYAVLDFAVAAVALIAVVGAVSSYVENYLTMSVSQWVSHDLRRTLYQHIQRLSLAEHDQSRTGDLMTRITSDISAVQDFVNSALLGMALNALTLAGMIGVMLYINWHFTLVALSIAPVLFLVVYHYTRNIKRASRAARVKESELLSRVQEALTSIRVVKAFAREDYEQKKFESGSLENVQVALQARGMKAKLVPLVEMILAVGTCLVLGYGARLALGGEISAGVLVVFLLYLGKMYKPMRDLSKMSDTVSRALVGYERIQEVLEIDSRIRDLPGARRAPKFKGQIEFKNVCFGYGAGDVVLKDVSFRVEAGQVVAIVGPSGTGKTTIASLIPRFYDPRSGQVAIDGKDVRSYSLDSLRGQISFVLQETLLFRATIWENIAYGKPDAAPEEIIRATKLADAHEFIAIARALIRDAPILILDEPTAGLDSASEQAVIAALERLMKGRTTLVIAHNLRTIRHADVIFVVRDSELVERGSHEALLATGGLYAQMYAAQLSAMNARAGHQARPQS
jgi:ATP-binding cassette subfamily B protein